MNTFLFIGNFLSKQRGTVSPSEQIIARLGQNNFFITKSSTFENRFLRLCDIIISTGFRKYSKILIDVFSGNNFIFTIVSAIVASVRKKSIVLTLHGGKLPEYFIGNKAIVNLVFKKASVIQTPSLFLKSFFEHQGYQVSYLPNPIDLDLFPYDRDNLKKFSLLWVRAFTPIYNPDIPIRILERLIKCFPEATLTMIGPDKGELIKIKKLTQELNLADKVTFTGAIPNKQLYTYYQTHHVYLNTTSFESFGVAVLEAAACGIPIVSNRVGEIPYIWTDQENIVMVEDNDIEQYVEQISLLFNDSHKVHEMSVMARRKAEEFDWKLIKHFWIKALSE